LKEFNNKNQIIMEIRKFIHNDALTFGKLTCNINNHEIDDIYSLKCPICNDCLKPIMWNSGECEHEIPDFIMHKIQYEDEDTVDAHERLVLKIKDTMMTRVVMACPHGCCRVEFDVDHVMARK